MNRFLRNPLFLLAFALQTLHAQRPAIKKILFVGNSYTAVNDLPNWTKLVGESMGDTFQFTTIAPGGTTFKTHSTRVEVLDAMKSGEYDAVILQEQSQRPSFPLSQVEADCFPFAKRLVDSARSGKSCILVMFYMTWGRQNGDDANCATWPPVCTFSGMNELLRQNYVRMAKDNYANVAPVGSVWRDVRSSSSINLYQSDGSHPSIQGTHLAALTMYRNIFGKDITSSTYHAGISDSDHKLIGDIVNRISKDSVKLWQYDTCYRKIAGLNNPTSKVLQWHIQDHQLKILMGNQNNLNLRLVDVAGRVYRQRIATKSDSSTVLHGDESSEFTIDLLGLAAGSYFLVSESGTTPIVIP